MARQPAFDDPLDGPGVPLPKRPVDVTRLAETTSAPAAPGDLDADAVVDRLDVGDDRPLRGVGGVEIGDRTFPNCARSAGTAAHPVEDVVTILGLIEVGDIYPREAGKPHQEFSPRRPGGVFPKLHDLPQDFFTVPHHNGVKDVGHRLGVKPAGAPGDNQGEPLVPIR